MTKTDLDLVSAWFDSYAAAYSSHVCDEDIRNYRLKAVHTHKVRETAASIAIAEECSSEDVLCAEMIGLLHDVGRFPQYYRYKTFKDSESLNHAAEGVKVIRESGVISGLPEDKQRLIVKCVALHNVFRIPEALNPQESFHLRLIRDADKLDIWRVFLEYYHLPNEKRASAAGLNFKDSSDCSAHPVDTILRGEMINLADVESINDFKLLQLSWVFDLNFAASLRLFRGHDYLDKYAAILPKDKSVTEALSSIDRYLNQCVNNHQLNLQRGLCGYGSS